MSWPGAEGMLSLDMMAPVSVAPGDWVFTSGYTLSYPGSREALTGWIEALPADIPFVFDPTPVISGHSARHPVTGACPHDLAELQHDAKRPRSPVRAISRQSRHGCWPTIARRRRAWSSAPAQRRRFVRLADGISADRFPASRSSPVDTNGAGDTHIGAFVSALSRGIAPFEAARYANAAAAHFGDPPRRFVGAERRRNPELS